MPQMDMFAPVELENAVIRPVIIGSGDRIGRLIFAGGSHVQHDSDQQEEQKKADRHEKYVHHIECLITVLSLPLMTHTKKRDRVLHPLSCYANKGET